MGPTIDETIQGLTSLALARLERERHSGYAEAMHTMRFPHQLGFTGPEEVQRGDVFARALLADALCDARDAGAAGLTEVLEEECMYLVKARRPPPGGWAYFPDLPELPGDTDVLAEVTQVWVRCGRATDLQAHLEEPLELLLRSSLREDGTVGTWILPAQPRLPMEQRQARFVREAWGDTSDVEVIANFLYALLLYDAVRFSDVIARGARWIQDQQASDGSWSSTWYAGAYYGTYACVRLLAALGHDQPLEGARRFLIDSQREDGGWAQRAFDQLATSLALCALATLDAYARTSRNETRVLGRGFERLSRSINWHGWKATPFIVMNLGRARHKAGPLSFYASSAITAAYALKASSLWTIAGGRFTVA